jgi:D,D-heptose 1,7-bisphosphate phosphatase
MEKSRAVFFDKDGTLIEDVPYNVNPDLIRLTAGACEAVHLLKDAGFKLFVITNQSGVARGFFAEEDLVKVWGKLEELLEIKFDGFYYCPHLKNGKIAEYNVDCDCRKPNAGLIFRAAIEHHIDLPNSWLIGDSPHDIEAGKRAGCQTILVGFEKTDENNFQNLMVGNLLEAVSKILFQEMNLVP